MSVIEQMTGLRKNIQEINSKFVGKGFYLRCITRNMTITFDKDIHVNASDIIVGKDISMTGEFVDTEYICNIKNL